MFIPDENLGVLGLHILGRLEANRIELIGESIRKRKY